MLQVDFRRRISQLLTGCHPVPACDQPSQQIDERIERFAVNFQVIVKGFNHGVGLRGVTSKQAGPT